MGASPGPGSHYREPAPSPEAPPRSSSRLARLLRSPLGVPLFAALDAALSSLLYLVHPVLAVLGSVALALGFMLRFGPSLEDLGYWFTGFLLVCTLALLLPLSGTSSLLLYAPARDVTVARAGEARLATVLYLRDASVRGELWGRYGNRSRRGTTVLNHSYAYPLADAQWTPERPVTAWAVCNSPRCGVYAGPPAGPVAVSPSWLYLDGYRNAVESARRTRRLCAEPEAPLFELYPSYREALAARAELPLQVSALFGVFWLLALARNAWRRRAR